jgi:hypothetical protein
MGLLTCFSNTVWVQTNLRSCKISFHSHQVSTQYACFLHITSRHFSKFHDANRLAFRRQGWYIKARQSLGASQHRHCSCPNLSIPSDSFTITYLLLLLFLWSTSNGALAWIFFSSLILGGQISSRFWDLRSYRKRYLFFQIPVFTIRIIHWFLSSASTGTSPLILHH